MKFYYFMIFTIGLVSVAGCKKKLSPSGNLPVVDSSVNIIDSLPPPPYSIPLDSAKWVVDYQGEIVIHGGHGGNPPYDYDTAYHRIQVVTSTGNVVNTYGHVYYVYNLETIRLHSSNPVTEEHSSGNLYVWEDTVAKKIYSYIRCPNCGNGSPTIAVDYDKNIDDTMQMTCYTRWHVSAIDSIKVGGKKYKKWDIANGDKEQFYQAYLIGGQNGFLPAGIFPTCSHFYSLDFIYKGDSLHFNSAYDPFW